MNKTELRDALASRTNMSKKASEGIIDALFGTDRGGIIAGELKAGRRVQITGFGTFETRSRKARMARNPRTGEQVAVKATTVPAFKAGRALKDRVS
jgi:DNA-binding protein HU-beta